jgi:hypothetical protein
MEMFPSTVGTRITQWQWLRSSLESPTFSPERMVQISSADGGSADDERAIGDGFGHRFELLGTGKHVGCTDRGFRLTEGRRVGIHHAQAENAEIAHRPCGRADVQRVARGDEDDVKAVELSGGRQARLF